MHLAIACCPGSRHYQEGQVRHGCGGRTRGRVCSRILTPSLRRSEDGECVYFYGAEKGLFPWISFALQNRSYSHFWSKSRLLVSTHSLSASRVFVRCGQALFALSTLPWFHLDIRQPFSAACLKLNSTLMAHFTSCDPHVDFVNVINSTLIYICLQCYTAGISCYQEWSKFNALSETNIHPTHFKTKVKLMLLLSLIFEVF